MNKQINNTRSLRSGRLLQESHAFDTSLELKRTTSKKTPTEIEEQSRQKNF